MERRAVRLLSRRYDLTSTGYKYLEIGINVGPPSYVEIALGDHSGHELSLSLEMWKGLYEQRWNIYKMLRNEYKDNFISVGPLTVRVCMLQNNATLVRLDSLSVRMMMTETTLHRMFEFDWCIDLMFEQLVRMQYFSLNIRDTVDGFMYRVMTYCTKGPGSVDSQKNLNRCRIHVASHNRYSLIRKCAIIPSIHVGSYKAVKSTQGSRKFNSRNPLFYCMERRAVRLLSRRYDLTSTGYKYLEIGINVGPPSYVEIALGDHRGHELSLSLETWKGLYEQRWNIYKMLRNEYKDNFMSVGPLTVRVCMLQNNATLVRLDSSSVRMMMTETTLHRMFEFDGCIDLIVEQLVRLVDMVDVKYTQFSNIAFKNAIRDSDASNVHQLVDCELLALFFNTYEKNRCNYR
ncbi:hypothetical protein ALC57_01190 [Trachymyrmex cornetzi]|uniref:Uncharacterized protein n=1 Tax=Trachymyrmex cornetzi TaxID=471704 RepID=A0A151JQV7_9HYME|nr:hypothetical protein ALC57_01190 [Trachymyrmex cornetzi]